MVCGFPQNAQVVQATEYLCKVEGHQLHLLLAEVTQNESILNYQGASSRILLIDLDSGAVITYTNVVWPESSDIASKEDALNMLFSCYLSWVEGYNPFIFADHEITFPVAQESIDSVNQQLTQHFCPPATDAQ